MKDDFKLDKDHYYNINDSKKQKDVNKDKIKDFSLLFISIFVFIFISLGGILLISKINNSVTNNNHINPSPEEKNNGTIKKFKDYTELKEFLEEGAAVISGYSYGSYLGGVNAFKKRMDVSLESSSESEIQTWGSDEKPAGVPINDETGRGYDYSTTNVQVGGVDEGDIVKTDGKYIYAVTGNEVVIIDAYPADSAKEISRIKFDYKPGGIYINGDKLAVYGENYNIRAKEEYKNILPSRKNNYTFLKIYDISEKNNPVLKRNFNFEGNLVNSRMIGDYIYFITSSYNNYYDDEFPVPIVVENGKVLRNCNNIKNCYRPDVYYFDIPYQSYNFTMVSSLNISDDNKKINSEVYLLDGYQNSLFVSKNNAYITFNKRVSEEELTMDIMMDMLREYVFPEMNERDKERISKIEKAENDVLSPMEKYQKIIFIVMRYENLFEGKEEEFEREMEKRIKEKYKDISKELEKTVIHRIEINDGKLKYKASGEVTGIVLNQFSMDESGGYFRIATTKNRSWSRFGNEDTLESYSNLYVLDKNMKVVGKIEELAKGERIYSVRFMQNRAYLVTFRQTDPLFVIGLEDPTNPNVLGELKVPGFSRYLHPYDNETLIGLGKETNDSGRVTGGVKLSLFDVSDVSNPKEIDKYVLGDRNSNSIAINEHKAFLFSKDRNLLVIPVSMEEDNVEYEKDIIPPIKRKIYFNGAVIFNVDKNGFNLKGKINHLIVKNRYNKWSNNFNVRRSLYIDNILYTISNKYLKANWISTLDEAKSIEFN